jgi:predicted butyrate kinase (DUF1464 family)
MVKAIGIDPGTKTMDIFGFDDVNESVIIDLAISRDEITKRPSIVIEKLREAQRKVGSIDAIVGPSGYGMHLKKAKDASDADIAMATFVTESDVKRRLKIIGLRQLMQLMRDAKDLNIWFTQGGIHLTTIPRYRKANKIDMGTADKVYSVILAVKDQAERLEIPYDKTMLILVEIGFAYTTAIAVRNGQIVDAIAGTAGFPSYLGMGFMDSELAYALASTIKDFSKLLLFSGGSASVANFDPFKPLEEFVKLAESDDQIKAGYTLMMESVIKDVAALLPSVKPREVILSGRFTKIREFLAMLKGRLYDFFDETGLKIDVNKLQSKAKVAKQAAEGAAMFANGIAGGRYKELIEVMKLKESEGTIFDNVYLGDEVVEQLNVFKRL